MVWTANTIMFWYDGATFQKITDHGRAPLTVAYERIDNSTRMWDGTMRRYTIAKKRTWNASWEMLPSTNTKTGVGGMGTADGGWAGDSIQNFYNTTDGAFQMQLRSGDGTIETVTVMITEFQKEITKRGPRVDYWNLSITLVEV